jgi:hypothetical protein
MAAILFSVCVSLLVAGWLWFYIVRPMLEGFGWITDDDTVNDYDDVAPVVMSRSDAEPSSSWRPSLETAIQTDRQTDLEPRIKAEQLLTVFKLMREAGISREAAAAAFKASGLPFNNNVWAKAEPPTKAPAGDEPAYVTPIAGRATNARFETDPDFPYQAPA